MFSRNNQVAKFGWPHSPQRIKIKMAANQSLRSPLK